MGLAILHFFRLSDDARSSKMREALFQEPILTWFSFYFTDCCFSTSFVGSFSSPTLL